MEAALRRHALASADNRTNRPSQEELTRVFTASTLPFIGFGFLDNFIMVCPRHHTPSLLMLGKLAV